MTMGSLPEILTAEHMAKYLGLSRRVIYDLLKTKPEAGGIPSFNIGYSVRAENLISSYGLRRKKPRRKEGAYEQPADF